MCFIINLFNWLTSMLPQNHFLIGFLILHGLPKKFCRELNLSIKHGLNIGKLLIISNMLSRVMLSQHLSRSECESNLASVIPNNSGHV